jgi:hypothetical protein
MKTIALLLAALAVLIAMLVFEHRRGTLVRLVDWVRDQWDDPHPTEQGNGPPAFFNDGPQCLKRLSRVKDLEYVALDAFGNNRGCGARFPVLVQSIAGIDIEGKGLTLSCPMAERLAQWVAKDVKRLGRKHGKANVTRLNHMGSYNCRKIAGSSSWSQHSFANALDVQGLDFEDGESLTILNDWDSQPILQEMAATACDRFNVVLSPKYNAQHKDHLHFDLGPRKTCR